MDDYISKKWLLEGIEEGWVKLDTEADTNRMTHLIRDIAPSADVVEVVRCKDCKWFNDIGCSIRIVDDSDKPTENDYCSFGERKDG